MQMCLRYFKKRETDKRFKKRIRDEDNESVEDVDDDEFERVLGKPTSPNQLYFHFEMVTEHLTFLLSPQTLTKATAFTLTSRMMTWTLQGMFCASIEICFVHHFHFIIFTHALVWMFLLQQHEV